MMDSTRQCQLKSRVLKSQLEYVLTRVLTIFIYSDCLEHNDTSSDVLVPDDGFMGFEREDVRARLFGCRAGFRFHLQLQSIASQPRVLVA